MPVPRGLHEGHHHLAVELTHEQAHRAHMGHPIQIMHHQMGKGHLFVHHENAQKIERAHRAGKGVRIHLGPGELMHTAHHHIIHGMDGTGFWGKLWHGIKSGYNWLKDHGVLTQLADAGANAVSSLYPEAAPAVGVVRNELHKRAGFGLHKKKHARGEGLYLS